MREWADFSWQDGEGDDAGGTIALHGPLLISSVGPLDRQLRALDRAATSYRELDRGRASLTLFDLARVALELRDPVIPLEIVRAGVACSVLPAGAAPGRSR